MKKLLSILCSKKIKYIIILLILFFMYTSICAISYVNAVSSNISNSVFRLHVIANSDSKEDQDLKYKVRDSLIDYMNAICKDVKNKDEAIQIAKEHTDDFYNIAKKTIEENGYNYDVTIEIGNFNFPTKTYGDISLPSGLYDALRVKIGNAQGKNWWCVMFPPLCFVNISSGIVPDDSKKELEESMEEESFSIISNTENNDIKFKFKLIEFFNFSNLLTAKK